MIHQDQLKQILLEQRQTVLQKEIGIKREALKEIRSKKKLPHVIVITGIRRSGKSTLLRQIIKEHYDDSEFYYVNFEDERLFNFQAKEFNQIYETLIELFGQKKTFFIDEIQNVPGFELFVRRFYEDGFKFYITGSNAKLLSKEIGTRLTGRHVNITVNPFSFKEVLKAKQIKVEETHTTKARATIKKEFTEYLIKGGMPEYIMHNDPETIIRVYEDIVIKDIAVRYKVENIGLLKELYQYLISTISQRFSYNSLRRFMTISSANTIKKYIDYLEETYLINQVNKFDYSMKKRIVNDKKVYAIDNGFVQNIAIKFTKDNGWLLENLVFNELKKKNDVFYFSGAHECDFITDNKAYQVCWNLNSANKDREINGLKEAMKHIKTDKGIILTSNQEEIIDNITVKPVWKWLLES